MRIPLATIDNPLRASKVSQFISCPMSVILSEEQEGGQAAQTGSLIHAAIAEYHTAGGEQGERVERAKKALERARQSFPKADEGEAWDIVKRYVADKANQEAKTPWVEQRVTLVLDGDIHIRGTLDQIRDDGRLTVWDIKTGSYHTSDESLLLYTTQLAVYTLAARQTLDPSIEPGGIIYTPAYKKSRSRVFLTSTLTVGQCEDIVSFLIPIVRAIRAGSRIYRPSLESCKFCRVGPWPKCWRET